MRGTAWGRGGRSGRPSNSPEAGLPPSLKQALGTVPGAPARHPSQAVGRRAGSLEDGDRERKRKKNKEMHFGIQQ